MRHRLHPISFKAALSHIDQNNARKVYVRLNNIYIRIDMCKDMSLMDWANAEYHVEEVIDG